MFARTRSARATVLMSLLVVVAMGCSTAAITPAPTPAATTPAATTPPAASATATPGRPSPTPAATVTASPTPAPVSLYLRSWSVHGSIGPINMFGNVPRVISDGQLRAVPLATDADVVPMYTGPVGRSLSQAALTTIVAEARQDGLLGKVTSFDCPPSKNGGEVIGGAGPDFLVLVVDGTTYELSAGACEGVKPSAAPGSPKPATWAAFEHFRTLVVDPAGWLGDEIGPAIAYDPDRLAVLVVPIEAGGPTPAPGTVVSWPLAGRFASFGVPFSGARCAVVSGNDAATLLAAVRSATADSVVRDAHGALAQLIVRPFMPGEPNPCKE